MSRPQRSRSATPTPPVPVAFAARLYSDDQARRHYRWGDDPLLRAVYGAEQAQRLAQAGYAGALRAAERHLAPRPAARGAADEGAEQVTPPSTPQLIEGLNDPKWLAALVWADADWLQLRLLGEDTFQAYVWQIEGGAALVARPPSSPVVQALLGHLGGARA